MAKSKKVIVTQQLLDENPEMVADGVKVGDEIAVEAAEKAPAKETKPASSVKLDTVKKERKLDKREQRVVDNAKKELEKMAKELNS